MGRLRPAGAGSRKRGRQVCSAVLIMCMVFLLASCGAIPDKAAAPEDSSAETAEPSPAPWPEAIPTSAPTLPPERLEDPAASAFAAPIPGVGVSKDGTFAEDALFIGDSLTVGMIMYLRMTGRLGGARYMGICTYSMQSFYGEPLLSSESAEMYGMECSGEFYNLTYAQAVKQAGDSVGAVYFMLGTNGSRDVTPESYTAIISYIRECCPHAVIYAQTIPYSVGELSDYRSVNSAILESVTGLRAAGDGNVYVLDTFTAIGTEHMSGDGLHLTNEGFELWYALIAGDRAS